MDDETQATKLRRLAEVQRLNEYFCPEKDSRDSPPSGVLLSDEIKHYVDLCKMIYPFCGKNLKAAGYELTVGDEYSLGGERKPLYIRA
jgi:hypothetical protein